jgi:mono/diheme cytochrome c family protein
MRLIWTFAVASLAIALIGTAAWLSFSKEKIGVSDPADARQVAMGQPVYANHCASCHGDKLQGEPNWSQRKPNGHLPAPPHDATGHTWHHTDRELFQVVKNGVTPCAPAGYQSDMPAFRKTLTDEQILAALAYIKSFWPEDIRERQTHLTEHAENGP